MDEVIWVDEKDNELGIVSRDKAHAEGLLHRIAVVYLVNDKGEILVQERLSGRLDHSVGGHVDPGETYELAALRELKEELGIENRELKEASSGIGLDIMQNPNKRGFINHIYKLYLCHCDTFVVNSKEIKSAFWANPLEIFNDMQLDLKNDKYVGGFKSSLKEYIQYLNNNKTIHNRGL